MTGSSTSTSITSPSIVVVVGLLVWLGLISAVPSGVPLAVVVGTLHLSAFAIVVVVAFVTFLYVSDVRLSSSLCG